MEQDVFQQRLEEDRKLVEEALHRVCQGWRRYADLTEAMEYSLLAGGKRIRPVLVLETCRLCGGDPVRALPLACGVEMIHTYSLIHDDLPAMDDDDLRRGRPTNHKVYGEATAILAGDGLLTAAFGVLTQAELPAERVVEAGSCLSREAGPEGREYARCIGRAFQIQDDILDVTSTDQELGKSVGSDRANEKNTFVTVLGLERSRALVEELTGQAEQALSGFGDPGFLLCLARALAGRRS